MLVALCLALFVAAVRADGPSAGELILPENNTATRFEIAADELDLRGATTRAGAVWIAPANGLAELRTRIGRHTAANQEPCPVLYPAGKPRNRSTRRVLTREVIVRLAQNSNPATVFVDLPGVENRGELPFASRFFLLRTHDPLGAPALAELLRRRPGVLEAEVQLARHYDPMLTPNDSMFPSQWHLLATYANSGSSLGRDLKLSSVWNTYRGAGIRIGIIDSGVQTLHPDLKPNIDFGLAYDFIRDQTNANPVDLRIERHGTAIAGIAAARGNNAIGVAGVAYQAKLVPHRLVTGSAFTAVQVANAFAHRTDAIHIKNNSWGSGAAGQDLAHTGTLLPATLATTAESGRGGRGTIHVFSAGNSGDYGGNVNYEGLLTLIWSVPVAAVTQEGTIVYYSNPGAALVVAAPSYRTGKSLVLTTDLSGGTYGYNLASSSDVANRDYTARFTGTSAAAPMVSGVVALMLQANPNLGWRDVQEILLRSASKNSPTDPDWATNSAGIKFHHRFGGGMLHALNAVKMAKAWVNLLPATSQVAYGRSDPLSIPDYSSYGVHVPISLTNENLRAEHVSLRLDIDHDHRGELEILLTSPGGMVSRLAERRNDTNANYKGWTFLSRAHWGERANGVWTVTIKDLVPGHVGLFLGARLEVRGTPADPVRLDSVACREVPGRSNGNGYPDPGELLEPVVSFRNTTAGSLTGLTATLQIGMADVRVFSATSTYPVILPGTVASNSLPFTFRAARSLCASRIPLTIVTGIGPLRTTNTFWQQLGRPLNGPPVTNVLASSDVPKPVADLQTVFSLLQHPTAPDMVLDDIDVSVRLDHTTIGDLQVAVRHPDGTEVLLSDHQGHNSPNFGMGLCGSNAVPTVFDDDSPTAMGSGSAPFAGSYRPDTPLGILLGKVPGGIWRLRLSDTFDNDFGTLNCWSIRTVAHSRTMTCDVFDAIPRVFPLTLSLKEGTSTNAVLTGTDDDLETISFVVTTPPQHGLITRLIPWTGSFTYASTPGYSGPDSFNFSATDGISNSIPATVSINILPASTNLKLVASSYRPETGFRVQISAPPGSDYLLERSGDLNLWVPVATNSAIASPFWLAHPGATNFPKSFYRVRKP